VTFKEVEKFNGEQVEFSHIQARSLQTVDEGDSAAARDAQDAKTKAWVTDLRRDPIVEEAIRVLNDWIMLPAKN